MIKEREVRVAPGVPALLITLAVFVLCVIGFIASAANEEPAPAVLTALLWGANLLCMFGLFTVAPNEAKVLQLFGRYVGSVREPGLKWANPFYIKRKISL